jgi:hypothetical protein
MLRDNLKGSDHADLGCAGLRDCVHETWTGGWHRFELACEDHRSCRISCMLNQLHPFGLRYDMELDERRLAAQVHKDEKAFVMLRTNMAQ